MTQLTFLGHSGVLLRHDGHTLCIDPFLDGNGLATLSADEIDADVVAFTHAHADHFNDDGLSIAKRCGATVVAPYELANHVGQQGIEKVEPINPGGAIELPIGRLAATPAVHSSALPDGRYMGACVGYLLTAGEHVIYHLGDTAYMAEFDTIRQLARPSVCLVPCGDRFTMGPRLATLAAETLQPNVAVPIHHSTFPLLTGDPNDFTPKGVTVKRLNPGETLDLG
jgi:L-ascorbate metabolism protein UlaG (beta-lactamase superfamily)